ncbi:MAG: hypothetical protein ACREOH_12625 [Candidatus Entotheonellia bacterium]
MSRTANLVQTKGLISMRVRRSTLQTLRRIADETGEYMWGMMRRLIEQEANGPIQNRHSQEKRPAEPLSTIWIKVTTRSGLRTRARQTRERLVDLIERLAQQELHRLRLSD